MASVKQKIQAWELIEIRIETGGVNYGLLPVEVGSLLGLSVNVLGAVIFRYLINKGVVTLNQGQSLQIEPEVFEILQDASIDDHSKRISISKHIQKLLHEYEYMVLQTIFPQKEVGINDLNLDNVFKFIGRIVGHRMNGYLYPETKVYYLELMEFISNRGGWVNSSKRIEWIGMKKALDLDPELGIEKLIVILSKIS